METDVLVVGGGTGGIAAAIGAARMGARVILTEETEWLGGMLTAAGVSAVDGNHHLPSGIWGEFRRELIAHYGSSEALATGWVSHTQFEPHIGNRIFHRMAESCGSLRIMKGYAPVGIEIENNRVEAVRFVHPQYRDLRIRTLITIDATEFGDIMAMAGCRYSLGRESRADSGEPWAPERADRITQDMTWVAILKDYGTVRRFEYPRPSDYDESLYRGCCRECFPIEGETTVDAQTMLNYGRLPNHKYMINWPTHGNDYYADLIELSHEERRKHFIKARSMTQGWLHFIQRHLGWTHLGLADDEFPTPDRLALIPYIRESRRVRGQVRVTLHDLLDPYRRHPDPLYRQAIAVGDYPVDHHHQRAALTEPEQYPSIPSFSIPYGALIPEQVEGLICAEKNISVSHIVNGASRLQPVVLQIGQAAGTAAAIATFNHCQPDQISIRILQQHLLDTGCRLMPFIDTQPDDPYFHAIQTCGLRGILRGRGEPHQWANRTWFYP
ncbi:MAG: FAD-dependent oxidoreductase, partial [Candidatus Delongbacteria bacterium]|nr:FAD-dependent oxidoreductase [Candidatus Delongbacteria bacterium]